MNRVECIGVIKGHTGPVYHLSKSGDPDSLYSSGSDGFIVGWNYRKFSQTGQVVRLKEGVYTNIFSSEQGYLVAGTSSGKIHLIDMKASKELKCLDVHKQGLFSFYLFDNQQKLLALGGDGKTSLWSFPDMTFLNEKQWFAGKCRQCVPFKDSNDLAIITSGGELLVIDLSTFELKKRFEAHSGGANSLAMHPAKPILLTGGRDAHLNTWKVDGEMEKLLSIPAHHFAIYSISFNPSGTLMATASRDKSIKIWDPSTLEILFKLEHKNGGHNRSVNDLLWLDDHLFASCSDDGSIRIWEVKTEVLV